MNKAFTLIEVMVALVILAIALLACLLTVRRVEEGDIHVRQVLSAHWVAENVLAQMQLSLLPKPTDQAENGSAKMLNQTWQWQAHMVHKNKSNMRVEIQVSRAHKTLTSLVGYV